MRSKVLWVTGETDVTGEERYLVMVEGEKKEAIMVLSTEAEAVKAAEEFGKGGSVSVWKQVRCGFREIE